MKFLILPLQRVYGMPLSGPKIEGAMTTLIDALESWYVRALLQLTVPIRSEDDAFRTRTQYIEAVIQFCPNIEYLDGYNRVQYYEDPRCGEMWFLNLQTWETFNASCTPLRDFNWPVVPFADPYFQVFGEHVKPRLRSLSLSAIVDWDYFDLFDHYTGSEELLKTMSRAADLVMASELRMPVLCSKDARHYVYFLIDLHIDIDFYRYLHDEDREARMCLATATHCSLLETIMLLDRQDSRSSLTDRTLVSLTQWATHHKRLSRCELGPARFTGNDIFKYLRCISKMKGLVIQERMLEVTVGGHHRSMVPKFYTVIVDLLKLPTAINEVKLWAAYCTKPELHVVNPYDRKAESNWCEGYMND